LAGNFYTMLTIIGKNKLSNSVALGSKINFKTLKVGDGKGAYYEPSENQTALVNTVWTGNITSISIDENNSNWVVVETVIPAADGGFFIREAGIFDDAGDLIAISKLAETYKPVVSEGSTKDLVIKIVLEVLNVNSVSLNVDPNVVVATKKDIQVLQVEIDDIREDLSNEIEEIKAEISNDTVITPSLKFGMNNVIKNSTNKSSIPKIKFYGKSLINLLGSDGNCENISKWNAGSNTLALDSSNKVFGSNVIKITLTATATGLMSKTGATIGWDNTKYYMISAYLKNGNATYICVGKDASGGGLSKMTPQVTDTTKFTRVCARVQPSDINVGNWFSAYMPGTSGQYAYIDGVMLNEITSDDYNNLTDSQLLVKYPYVDGYACLTNPAIEIRHNNLVRNGNCEEGIAWWTPTYSTSTLSIDNGKFKVTDATQAGQFSQYISVKKNTDYYFIGNLTVGTANPYGLRLYASDGTLLVNLTSSGSVSFNTGENTTVKVVMRADVGYMCFDSIMLVEGTNAPTYYKSCEVQKTVIEGQFADGDYVIYDNGEVTGQINSKHATLLGKDYDWQFALDYTGYKAIAINNFDNSSLYSNIPENTRGVKYNGDIMQSILMGNGTNSLYIDGQHKLWVSVSDSDTGWSDTLNPNNDEAKVFMNGWRAIKYLGSRYVAWLSIIDNSFPFTTAVASGASNSGQNILTVSDGSKFIVGRSITLKDANGTFQAYYINSISGNQLTLSINLVSNIVDQTPILMWDDGSSDLRNLNYCKNNIAPGYEGYRIHYKTQNPIPVNDTNAHLDGENPIIDIGDNYINIDCGWILGEVASIKGDGTTSYINLNGVLDANGKGSELRYKTEFINSIYRNEEVDTYKWSLNSVNAYGNQKAYIPATNVDPNGLYTVDYIILRTIAPQIGSFECSFSNDIVSILNKLAKDVGNKQTQDDILTDLVDASIYETLTLQFIGKGILLNWGTPYIWMLHTVSIVPKKVTPTMTVLSDLEINCMDSSGNITNIAKDCEFFGYIGGVKKNSFICRFRYIGSNATIKSNLITNGYRIVANVILDCKDKI